MDQDALDLFNQQRRVFEFASNVTKVKVVDNPPTRLLPNGTQLPIHDN